MSGVNKAILIGNLGADPETRYTPGNVAVTRIRIATSETWRDRGSGENQERTEWHRVVLFAKLGEIAAEYLRKGAKVYIEGRIQTRKWQGQDGQDRYTTEIVADQMQMLDARAGGAVPVEGEAKPSPPARAPRAAPAAPSARAPRAASSAPAATDPGFDDDIPF